MLLLRRRIEDDPNDHILIGIFPIVDAKLLLELVDELVDYIDIEFTPIRDAGMLIDSGTNGLFSEWREGFNQDYDTEPPELSINTTGCLFIDYLTGKRSYCNGDYNWFDLKKATEASMTDFEMMDPESFMEPVKTRDAT